MGLPPLSLLGGTQRTVDSYCGACQSLRSRRKRLNCRDNSTIPTSRLPGLLLAVPSCGRAVLWSGGIDQVSIKIMSRVWEQPAASHTEKLILLCLADCASDEGVCWPSYATIARKCQMERSRVIEAIARFEKRGLLKKKAHKAANGHPSSNRYTLNIGFSTLEGGGAPTAPRVVPQQHQGSAPGAPTLEPSLDPSDRTVRGKPPKSPKRSGSPRSIGDILRAALDDQS